MRTILFFVTLMGLCRVANTQIDTFKVGATLLALDFTSEEILQLKGSVRERLSDFQMMHNLSLDNSVSPALYFDLRPAGFEVPKDGGKINWELPQTELPKDHNDLAFYSILQLASLIQARKVTSVELTTFFIERLKKYSNQLECTITITERRALEHAERADSFLQAGIYLGPLHGIPYGAKDLFAVAGYRTTWGATPYKEQMIGQTSDVIKKLDTAGAILVAKLTLGALAMGDVWYGGTTKNPWNLEQGSSGSSAGSASATVAGLVPFALGTETRGSITSPSTRCGATGLRPTFGRVSRAGAMALSWSMDKIGPICRSAEDCAIVFDIIKGSGQDRTAVDAAFPYEQDFDVKSLKVGYFKNLFDSCDFTRPYDEGAFQVLEKMGIDLQPVDYYVSQPVSEIGFILIAEAAAAFDELTRSGQDSLLVRQMEYAWPNTFRAARFIPAVEYIQANRIRTLLIEEFHQLIKDYDVIITPTFEGTQLLTTNLTGQPVITLPHGFAEDGTPRSITFLGNLYDEHKILALAKAFQVATQHNKKHPPDFIN